MFESTVSRTLAGWPSPGMERNGFQLMGESESVYSTCDAEAGVVMIQKLTSSSVRVKLEMSGGMMINGDGLPAVLSTNNWIRSDGALTTPVWLTASARNG